MGRYYDIGKVRNTYFVTFGQRHRVAEREGGIQVSRGIGAGFRDNGYRMDGDKRIFMLGKPILGFGICPSLTTIGDGSIVEYFNGIMRSTLSLKPLSPKSENLDPSVLIFVVTARVMSPAANFIVAPSSKSAGASDTQDAMRDKAIIRKAVCSSLDNISRRSSLSVSYTTVSEKYR